MTRRATWDLTLQVSSEPGTKLSRKEREESISWVAEHLETAPDAVRKALAEPLEKLLGERLPQKEFNRYSRQLARAMGFIPSSEKRRPSGRPLDGVKLGKRGRKDGAHNEEDWRKRQGDYLEAQTARHDQSDDLSNGELVEVEKEQENGDMIGERERRSKLLSLTEKDFDKSKLSSESRAELEQRTQDKMARYRLGDGEDPSLVSSDEALMNADVVCTYERDDLVAAELPEDMSEDDVVETLVEPRVRFDFEVTVTRINLEVEKKVVVTKDGKRRVVSGSVSEYGPKGFSVTWKALATLAVLIGQFALPLNRLGTMLSTATKRFTSTSLARMAHYVAERFVPIYLVLMEQLADSDILAGDDTSCRVVEVSSHYRDQQRKGQEQPPWASYRNVEAAQQSYLEYLERKEELLARRQQGDREAKKTAALDPPLKVLVGRELNFESQRKGGGPKQSLNTTVVTGRVDPDDPRSLIVFYRSHLGSLGNLLEMILSRRKRSANKLTVQADLSTTNLVTDPKLTSCFDIELVGCSAHARRPFAQYEDQDLRITPIILEMFRQLATQEKGLDMMGRNRQNTLAVRSVDSRKLWETIKWACTLMARKWTKATPLGTAARYVLTHYERLTAYLKNPRLDATNNLRERLLRTEKLIEKSSLFRRSIEGRVVLDILRTILQTAVAAGVPPHEYLVSVMKSDPKDIEEKPERYTPAAWARHSTSEQVLAERLSA